MDDVEFDCQERPEIFFTFYETSRPSLTSLSLLLIRTWGTFLKGVKLIRYVPG